MLARLPKTPCALRIFRRIRLFWVVGALLFHPGLRAADWQWSVPLQDLVSTETNDHPRAFLWIPPDCKRLRGVVVAQHNMQEESILEHPVFRKALSELGFAEIWVTPGLDLWFRFDQGAGDSFNSMMHALAAESGYDELVFVPVVPIGHSAAASFPWNFAAWNPARTLAAMSVSGQWPFFQNPAQPAWGAKTIDGVPGIVAMGEYEAAASRAGEGLNQRKAHPQVPLSMLQEPAAGHFDATDAKVEYLALYLKKAAQYRLPQEVPPDKPAVLTPIDPAKTGWLVDRWRPNEAPTAPAAPVSQYTGDAQDAFWFFDEEMAHATEKIEATDEGKKADLVGYLQQDQVVPQNPKFHAQVKLQFLPLEDGITFKLTAAFLDSVPEGRPESWTGLPKGSPIAHASGGGPIVIERICGPVQKLSTDTFAIRFYRMGMENSKRSNDIWLRAVHPGDGQYRRAVQQAQLNFPRRNTAGTEQKITFPDIRDQHVGSAFLQLNAKSDASVPVYYYVREGPAEIVGDQLVFTAIPPRARYPVKVTVVAWQWGRSIEPRLKTADPVERTFFIKQTNSRN